MEFEKPELQAVYTKDYLRSRLFAFRDWYSDEIPEQLVHSPDLESRYKVRTAWFTGLSMDLNIALDVGILPNPQIIDEVKYFLNWYESDFGPRGNIRNTREDIEVGNKIIQKVLDSMPVEPVTLGKLE